MGAGSPSAPSLLSVTGVSGACAAENGAEVLLAQLESRVVDCIFASPIAVMASVWEALARRANDMTPHFRCRHESRAALQRALEAVASGRTFLLDVVVNP